MEVSLFDLKGRKVFSQKDLSPLDGSLELALPELPAGIYIIRAWNGSNQATRKLALWR